MQRGIRCYHSRAWRPPVGHSRHSRHSSYNPSSQGSQCLASRHPSGSKKDPRLWAPGYPFAHQVCADNVSHETFPGKVPAPDYPFAHEVFANHVTHETFPGKVIIIEPGEGQGQER